MAKKQLPEFVMKMPKLSTKTVWVGAYGGHYDIIMIFSSKPKLEKQPFDDEKAYDSNDPTLIGTISPDDWETWFGDLQALVDVGIMEKQSGGEIRPLDTECRKVVQIKLTAAWYDHPGDRFHPPSFEPVGISFHADH